MTTNNNAKTYKWVIGILIAVLIAIISFIAGGQLLTVDVRANTRRIDRNEIRVEQIMAGMNEIKAAIQKQDTKLDAIMLKMANK